MGAKLASLSGVLGATQDRGLSFITSTTFSAASSVSVDGCFTASYTNYLLIIDVTSQSAAVALTLKLRVSGTDASTNYGLHGNYGGTVGSGAVNDNSVGYWATISPAASGTGHMTVTLLRPAEASATKALFAAWDNRGVGVHVGGTHDTATAYDGLTLGPTSGTITGTLRAYGYRND